ncbi:MAG: thrombospondin type 3 repeat-containing protein [Deltaproteobacteria bacterium]|nr:thrombospondin type 3 repeat-containing protein [Deltaproteobacteria bacterium]
MRAYLMTTALATTVLTGLLMPAIAFAGCPAPMDPELDWDGDGIVNGDDDCCFVTSLWEDYSGKMCGDGRSADMNGNGISAANEGMCCVDVSMQSDLVAAPLRSWCYRASYGNPDTGTDSDTVNTADTATVVDTETVKDTSERQDTASVTDDSEVDISTDSTAGGPYQCDGSTVIQVPCDQLLLYDGMAFFDGTDSGSVSCSETTCICYTIGDYDEDDSFDEGGFDGPFDNCPVTWNAAASNGSQADADGDFYGDACDLCHDQTESALANALQLGVEEFEKVFLSLQCEIGGDDCPGAACVPRAFENPLYFQGDVTTVYSSDVIWVGNFCSSPSDVDGDGVGDVCDNCIDEWNEEQGDRDSDSVGNVCDACPLDPQIGPWVEGMVNSDEDRIIDSCDNCPLVTNPWQLDGDSDGVGNACDLCPWDGSVFTGLGDMDSDGNADICDPCPRDAEVNGMASDYTMKYPDGDSDGYADVCDNCAAAGNPDQADIDSDGIGDACDTDSVSQPADTATDSSSERHDTASQGAVSFSGGGVISCQVFSPGKTQTVSHDTIITLFVSFFDLNF